MSGVQCIDSGPTKVVNADSAILNFERRTEDALLEAALGTAALMDQSLSPKRGARDKPKAVVTPIRSRKAKKEDLIAGANAWGDL